MHTSIDGALVLSESSLLANPAIQVSEIMRGRTRHRNHARGSITSERADESSTLRGRSRQRASSPIGSASRNHSPSLMSPPRHFALHNRLRDGRREHCPSRATSPSGRKASLRQGREARVRSSSRGRRPEGHRTVDSLSSLRNEFFAPDEISNQNINDGPTEETK